MTDIDRIRRRFGAGFVPPAKTLSDMIGRPVVYRNEDATPKVELLGWLDSLDEGWAVVEFAADNRRATVRPSRIVAYAPMRVETNA